MNEAAIKKLLYIEIPQVLIDSLIDSYKKALSQYKKENWDYFGNDCGKFNEIFFRIIQLKLEGNYTPLEKKYLYLMIKFWLTGKINLQL